MFELNGKTITGGEERIKYSYQKFPEKLRKLDL